MENGINRAKVTHGKCPISLDEHCTSAKNLIQIKVLMRKRHAEYSKEEICGLVLVVRKSEKR